MGAELVVRAIVRPLGEQVQIEIGQDPAVSVRIIDLAHVIAVERDAEAVIGIAGARIARRIQPDFKNTGGIDLFHRPQLAGGHQAELDRSRLGLKRANHRAAAAFVAMRPEQRKRIAVARFDEQPNRAGRRRFDVVIDRSHFSEDSKPGTAT